MIPQILYLMMCFLGLGIEAAKHGQDKEGQHSFWSTLISCLISWLILYYGGFFNVFFK